MKGIDLNKKNAHSHLRICIQTTLIFSLLLLLGGQLQAQSSATNEIGSPVGAKEAKADHAHSTAGDSAALVNEKYPRVMKSFWREFPNASDARWYIGKNCVYVYYELGGRRAVSVIRHGGFIEYSARYLNNTELPENYSSMISAKYTGFMVVNVREITVNSETSFIVLLENESGFVEVSARFPEIQELRKVSKG